MSKFTSEYWLDNIANVDPQEIDIALSFWLWYVVEDVSEQPTSDDVRCWLDILEQRADKEDKHIKRAIAACTSYLS